MNISKFFVGLFLMVSSVVFGQDFNEIEPNNTALTANKPTLPTTLVGAFLTVNDVDYFRVTVPEGGVLTLNGITTNDSRLEFSVLDENQVKLAGKVSGGTSQPLILPCIVKAGTFFITVSNYNNGAFASGGYRLQTSLDRTDACEYNGTFNTACLIPSTTTVSGKIWGLDGYTGRRSTFDNDMFKISVMRGGVLKLNIKQVADGQRPTLRVFNDQQRELVGRVAPIGVTNFGVAANIPEAGTYYIEIEDYNNAQINSLYALDVVFDISDNCEYNNNFTKACEYTIGQLYQGKMCGLDGNLGTFDNTDSDFFVFSASVTGLYNFRLTGFPTGSRMTVRIFNETQQELSGSTSGSNVNQFNHAYTIPRIGRYYVVLQEYNGAQYCDASYRFQVGLATPTADIKNTVNFSISPNPANDRLNLNYTEGYLKYFKISNLMGQVLIENVVNGNQTGVNTQPLAKGLYLLTVTTMDGQRATKSFVKN